MSIVRPFPAVRPAKEKAHLIAALPYDVMSSDEAREMVKGNPLSFLHVDKAEIDLPREIDLYDERVYQKAKENFYSLIDNKHFIKEEKPCFYLYQQVMNGHAQTGLVAGASIEEYEKDLIKKHEHTRADKEADRIKHVDTLNAQTGPIFLTYRAQKNITDKMNELMKDPPLYDFTAEDDVRHIVWRIDKNEDINFFMNSFKEIECLYIADGHHRSASAVRVGQRRRDANPNHTGEEEYNFFLSVIFPHDQLAIYDYNRIVVDLNGNTKDEFMNKVNEKFEIEEYSADKAYRPEALHTFGMYIDKIWYKLTAKNGTFPADDPVGSLDVSIMQNNLLEPILGIKDPRTDNRIDFIGGIRGLDELSKRVDAGEAVAFSMHPTSVDELINIADAGMIMPPKSTWFEPKLRSGLLCHLLS
ncbi:MAG: DUF1015 family protein [Candidatus Cloacimonadales bacterium]|nr:DUF1015 family protein [Candidatus Cloacimonadota bacterium]MDD2649504.1 DUF1015 family protein [Candidatus Cloacimonadota bacterium]MDD3501361.1 DUF1015 family protein [Candidatus Cloacimonadota bacterium]MDX9977548.1 DUF1015 family protein [Candidatus Cloacimonadales bacterium]